MTGIFALKYKLTLTSSPFALGGFHAAQWEDDRKRAGVEASRYIIL
jgi:hypothetical protein